MKAAGPSRAQAATSSTVAAAETSTVDGAGDLAAGEAKSAEVPLRSAAVESQVVTERNASAADDQTDRAGVETAGADAAAYPVIVQGLVKAYGRHVIFNGFELRVEPGERLAILGASGCGKSTLLRCIAGLESPDAGTVTIAGEVGFVFQEPRLFPWLSVEANIGFAARTDLERARVGELIDLVGLNSARTRLPKALSGGMAQRAALARALVRKPQVILLDEPLAALDALLRLELRAALREIVMASGATSILVTHDVDEALGFAERCIVLERDDNAVRARVGIAASGDGARLEILGALGVRDYNIGQI